MATLPSHQSGLSGIDIINGAHSDVGFGDYQVQHFVGQHFAAGDLGDHVFEGNRIGGDVLPSSLRHLKGSAF